MTFDSKVEGYVRLTGGGILNLCLLLWLFFQGLSPLGNGYGDLGHAVFYAIFAMVAFTFIVPTFWRCGRWQAAVAFVLLCVPGIILFRACQFIIGHL